MFSAINTAVDFRGRLNALEAFNYATADTKRSLFRFASPAEITDRGLDWLRIHTANCYGHDKLSYQLNAFTGW